jgi:hypothetical protein
VLLSLSIFSYAHVRPSLYKNLSKTKITEAKIFNFAFMYIGDIRSINNPDFANWIPLIYPQRTWDKGNYRNMVLHDITSNDTNGQPSIRRYDKGDDYNFAIINCPHLDSNIPTAPAYGVYISQLVRYARACSLYPDYWQRRRILRTKLLNQGLLKNHFILSFKTVFGRYQHLVEKYSVSCVHMTKDGIGNYSLV